MRNRPIFNNCYQTLQSVGIIPEALNNISLVPNTFQRVPTEKHPRKRDGSIYSFPDGGFICRNFSTDQEAIYIPSHTQEKLSKEEIEKRIRVEQLKRSEENRKREQQYFETAKQAAAFWRQCEEPDFSNLHPYYVRKKISPVPTIRETTVQRYKDFFGCYPNIDGSNLPNDRLLIIPLIYRNSISSLQLISDGRTKKFLFHGRTGGCYWQSERLENPEIIAIAEGVATVLSFIQHSAEHMLGVSAMNAGNLPKVTKIIRNKYPHAQLIICGDNDESDVGRKKALEALSAIDGKATVLIPEFSSDDIVLFKSLTGEDKNPSDWNDYYLIRDHLNRHEANTMQLEKETSTASVEETTKLNNDSNCNISNNFQSSPVQAVPSHTVIEKIYCDSPDEFFELRDNGVFFISIKHRKSEEDETAETKVCDPLWITYSSSSTDCDGFGKLLEWNDSYSNPHTMFVLESEIQNDFKTILGNLADGGLGNILLKRRSFSRDLLQLYVHLAKPAKRNFITEKLGWSRSKEGKYSYVLPNKTIGEEADAVIFDAKRTNMQWISSSGTLEDWQDKIAEPALASARIVFAICVPFASPLLGLLGQENRFFHFTGRSGSGKTTAMKFAQSVMGFRENLPTWRTTSNGLERTALAHNDSTMFLDEIGETESPNQLGSNVYLLCNGVSKGRANKALTCSKNETWRLLGLASGEVDLRQMGNANKLKIQTGQELRLVNIPEDVNSKYGLFDKIPSGFTSVAEYLEKANLFLRTHYGTAFEEWIEYLSVLLNSDEESFKVSIRNLVNDFLEEALEKTDNNQIRRVCKSFALVAVAGDIASGGTMQLRRKVFPRNITGWSCNKAGSHGDAWNAVMECFKAWVKDFGTTKLSKEDQEIINDAKFIFETQKSRFIPEKNSFAPPNQIGWTRERNGVLEYLVCPESFKSNFCKGRNQRYVDSVLKDAGILIERYGTCHPETNPKKRGLSTCVRVLIDSEEMDNEE